MQWEYAVQTLNAAEAFAKGQVVPRELQDVLNLKGREGWELVSAFETNSGREGSRLIVLTFKRPMDLQSESLVRAG